MGRLGDYWDAHTEGCLGAAILLLLGAVAFLAIREGIAESEASDRFIVECEAHEPHYKCVVLWRAGQDHTQVVPMPVVVPVGR